LRNVSQWVELFRRDTEREERLTGVNAYQFIRTMRFKNSLSD